MCYNLLHMFFHDSSHMFFHLPIKCENTKTSPGDDIDNDCDGQVDEEVKDGKDNDGDGRIDEDIDLVLGP